MSEISFTMKAQEASSLAAVEEFNARLAKLNIPPEKAQNHGLSLINLEDMPAELGFSRGSGAIKIEYPGTKFARYRFLGMFEGYKYHQPRGSSVHVYTPLDVVDTFNNVDKPLIITEGEFKAIACKSVPTIALGGVSSITKDVAGVRCLIEPLNSLPIGKKVYICFDYDPEPPFDGNPKKEVLRAEERLAVQLLLRGADVYLCRLGAKNGHVKVGLDDFIIDGGDINAVMAQSKQFIPKKQDGLPFLLSNYAMYHGDIVHINSGEVYSATKFHNQEANCINPYEDKDADDKEPKPSKKFLMDLDRVNINSFVFDPKRASIITPTYDFNTWRGIKTKPIHGQTKDLKLLKLIKNDVKLWLDFQELFFSNDPFIRSYFEECMALSLQRPDIKQERICILQSNAQGIGKSFYFETIASIFNDSPRGAPNGKYDHALVTSGGDLWDNFNSLIASKKFLVLNEIGEKGEKHTNLLKDMSTSRSFTVNEKYVKAKSIRNYLQLCITTNEAYTHIVDVNGRREAIYNIPTFTGLVEKLKDFFATNNALKEWVNTPKARSQLLDYYLNYQLNGYDGSQPAPLNESKLEFAEATKHASDLYIDELINDGIKYVVPKLEFDKYVANNGMNISIVLFRTKLKKAGFINGPWDHTHGQLQLAGKSNIQLLQRPCVLMNSSYTNMSIDKNEILVYLATRYYPGVSLL